MSDPGTTSCLGEEQLVAFARGSLPGELREAADRHLDGCSTCQALLALAAQALDGTERPFARGDLNVLAVGTLVAGRYRVLRFVARGGMGEVYEAQDQVLDERIALKTLSASAMDDAKAILRLRAEVQLARRVSHPHACRIHDLGTHRPREAPSPPLHFLTMEYVAGRTLAAELRARGRFAPGDVQALALQLIDGLSAAHRVGILHRDFKSDNVMLRAERAEQPGLDAVIMDFGLARVVHAGSGRLTSSAQALLGSAAYMAPEQVEGSELTPAADLYAFGVVLFELLTGELPFRGSAPIPTALQRLHKPPPRPSSLVRALSPRWDALVLGCLERRVEQRFASAEQVRAALVRLDSSAPRASIAARPRWDAWLGGMLLGGALTAAALIQRGPTPQPAARSARPQRESALCAAAEARPPLPEAPERGLPAPKLSASVDAPSGDTAPAPRARAAPRLKPKAATLSVSHRPSDDPLEGFLEPTQDP